ncbi:Spliceosome RNA helicase DDX39B [Dictyocoela muelleri]|nr:Spliceosome RNA helicase DDX39B [Dictyocoela muelleri]
MSDNELIDYEEKPQDKLSNSTIHCTDFKDFLLRTELMDAIKDAEFEHPSEVQQQCIPKALMGVDILCQARSGTGKTNVFVISCLNQLHTIENETCVLVICHTKEMADQIKNEFVRLGKYLKVSVECFYGGNDVSQDAERLKKGQPTIVVGTIGRILDLLKNRYLHFRHLKHLVIDEVDHIISNLDQRADLQEIIYETPVKKQTMMFTATLSEENKRTCLLFLRNPLEVYVDEKKLTLHGLTQSYLKVKENEKEDKLMKILDMQEVSQCVIFVSSKHRAKYLARFLNKNGFPSIEIHSDLTAKERISRFNDFKDLKFRIMIATDLMARGIDVQEVNLVINYDMPRNADIYLHRVGRAGRFETKGSAISFVSTEEDVVVMNDVQSRFEVSVTNFEIK